MLCKQEEHRSRDEWLLNAAVCEVVISKDQQPIDLPYPGEPQLRLACVYLCTRTTMAVLLFIIKKDYYQNKMLPLSHNLFIFAKLKE
jgi:hypothetical protein